MRLANAPPAQPLRPLADAEIDEMLQHAGSLDEPDVVLEVVADRQQRVLRVDEVVVPSRRDLSRHLAVAHFRRERPRQKAVEAQRLEETEIGVEPSDLIAIRRGASGLA